MLSNRWKIPLQSQNSVYHITPLLSFWPFDSYSGMYEIVFNDRFNPCFQENTDKTLFHQVNIYSFASQGIMFQLCETLCIPKPQDLTAEESLAMGFISESYREASSKSEVLEA